MACAFLFTASEKQILANRRNSQHSTGPRSEAGKSVSRMNALQSGLHAESLTIRSEEPAAFEALKAEYYAELAPAGAVERDLVDTIIHNQWMLRRYRRVEEEIWAD